MKIESRDRDNRRVELTARVVIEGVESEECPKSRLLMSPSSDALVQIFIQEQTIGGGLGDPSRWSGAFF
jgi:hypothetical protein